MTIAVTTVIKSIGNDHHKSCVELRHLIVMKGPSECAEHAPKFELKGAVSLFWTSSKRKFITPHPQGVER